MAIHLSPETVTGVEQPDRHEPFFRCHQQPGGYPLPAVLVTTDPGARGGTTLLGWAVSAHSGPPPLRTWLQRNWPVPFRGSVGVSARARLSSLVEAPEEVLRPEPDGPAEHDRSPTGAGYAVGRPVRAELTWQVDYVENGHAQHTALDLVIEFAPPVIDLGDQAQADQAQADRARAAAEPPLDAGGRTNWWESAAGPGAAAGAGAAPGPAAATRKMTGTGEGAHMYGEAEPDHPGGWDGGEDVGSGRDPGDGAPGGRGTVGGRGGSSGMGRRAFPPLPPLRRLSQFVDENNQVVPPMNPVASIDFGTSACTVTLRDSREGQPRHIDPSQAERLYRGFTELLSRRPPANLGGEWDAILDAVVAKVAQSRPDLGVTDPAGLVVKLTAGADNRGTDSALLELVASALEDLYGRQDDQARRWLAERLHAVYDSGLGAPALDTFSLQIVDLQDLTSRTQCSSTIYISDRDPLTISLGSSDQSTGDPKDIVHTVKNQLGKPKLVPDAVRIDQRPADTDYLIALAYQRLIELTERFAAGRRSGPLRPLQRAVITYPTITAPSVRARLREIAEDCLDLNHAETQFDEGVAAALFFLLRDFGQDTAAGVEVLRSRSRRISSDPPTWKQTMLVIDIGGGTTDIALIDIRLIDLTEPVDGVDPGVQGHFYVVRPELRGSTGHRQLGGNYLTLRALYWIKARIVDDLLRQLPALGDLVPRALRTPDGAVRPLAPEVVTSSVERPAPELVTTALAAVFPTAWRTRPEARNAFNLLWQLAEDVKIELGEGRDVTIDADQVRDLIAALKDLADLQVGEFVPTEIVLTAADFARIARPVLDKAVDIAAAQVETWLRTSPPDERLDRVVLSGRTTAMNLMTRAVAEKMGRIGEAGGAIGNDSGAITTERRLAKQAASIGAAWAHAHYDNRPADPRRASDILRHGRTVVHFEINNLFATLPCDFRLKGVGRVDERLLTAGQRLLVTAGESQPAARSLWFPLQPQIDVHRPIDADKTISWGVFTIYQYAREEDFLHYDPAHWLGDRDRGVQGSVQFQLQIRQDLTPALFLCSGDPHHQVDENGQSLLGRLVDLRPDLLDSSRARIGPGDLTLYVRRGTGWRGAADLVEVRFWSERDTGSTLTMFPLHFHTGPHLGGDPTRAALSTTALPRPPEGHQWDFLLRGPDGNLQEVARLEAPGGWSPEVDFHPSLTVDGVLRIHRGQPAYLMADRMRDVEAHPGSVARLGLNPGEPDYAPLWDPFTGDH